MASIYLFANPNQGNNFKVRPDLITRVNDPYAQAILSGAGRFADNYEAFFYILFPIIIKYLLIFLYYFSYFIQSLTAQAFCMKVKQFSTIRCLLFITVPLIYFRPAANCHRPFV